MATDRSGRASTDAKPRYDLVIRNGTIVDLSQRINATSDVGINGERIAAVAPGLAEDAARTLDATGLLVTPGLVDLHAHIWAGVTALGIDADPHSLLRGVTTVVDAGSAGADTFPGFRRYVMDQVRTRTLAFLNISAMGQLNADIGELCDIRWAMVDRAVELALAHPDVVVGIKVRLSAKLAGVNGVAALDRALEAAEQLGCPLMVHIGGTEQSIEEILGRLRSGDILTHSYTGWKPGIIGDNGHVLPDAVEARRRGVKFDVGHGQGSFTFSAAEQAIEDGFPPDTISSDLHRFNLDGPVYDLVTTLSKFLYLGVPLDEVIAMATIQPARTLARTGEFGSLRVGMPADVSILRLADGPTTFIDAAGERRHGNKRLIPILTIRAGKLYPAVGYPDAVQPHSLITVQ